MKDCLRQPKDSDLGKHVWTADDHGTPGYLGTTDPSVVSWNVDGIRSQGVLDSIIALLRDRKPRALLLWEIKCDGPSLQAFRPGLRGELSDLGYKYVSHYW